MGETVNQNFKIDEDRKAEWAEFIEEHPDINTYTSLIKKAVSKFIGQYYADEDEDTLDEELILDRFSDIESRLQDTHNTVQVIQDQQDEYRVTQDDIQLAALLANEEFWEAEGLDLSKLPMSDREEWERGD
jgi:uncharacterized membrane protein YfbV (UPF0208 family)